MIQANELRIGSWVLTKNLYAKVEGIVDSENISIAIDGYNSLNLSINQIKPIKLTEDNIISCGFRHIGLYDNVYHSDNFRIYLNKKLKIGLLKLDHDSDQLEIEIRSVHQLQNVYFILTGEELEVSFQNS